MENQNETVTMKDQETEINSEADALEALLARAAKYGTQEAKQINLVEDMLKEEGAEAIGMAYYIGKEGSDQIFCVDPWANVLEYKSLNLSKDDGDKEDA